MRLIDEFLADYDFAEMHEIQIQAPVDAVYRQVLDLDLSGSAVIRALFKLRELPALFSFREDHRERLGLTFAGLVKSGFVLLGQNPGQEIALGLVGRFWTPSGGIQRLDANGFRDFATAGFAKAVWNFSFSEKDSKTILSTETRIACLDNQSRRKFRVYWTFIRPFSGLIRKQILKSIKMQAETRPV